MQPHPIPVGPPQAEDKSRLARLNSDLECSFGRLIVTHSFVEKEDPNLSGYVFDDSLLLASLDDEKSIGKR